MLDQAVSMQKHLNDEIKIFKNKRYRFTTLYARVTGSRADSMAAIGQPRCNQCWKTSLESESKSIYAPQEVATGNRGISTVISSSSEKQLKGTRVDKKVAI